MYHSKMPGFSDGYAARGTWERFNAELVRLGLAQSGHPVLAKSRSKQTSIASKHS